MATQAAAVTGGIDTHKHTHYAAAVDDRGQLLGHPQFPATDRGYQELLAWMRGHGQVTADVQVDQRARSVQLAQHPGGGGDADLLLRQRLRVELGHAIPLG